MVNIVLILPIGALTLLIIYTGVQSNIEHFKILGNYLLWLLLIFVPAGLCYYRRITGNDFVQIIKEFIRKLFA